MAKAKILVVDDEANIRKALQGILTDEGYEVALAGDGETALRMARAEAPDLALLDIWIPGIDGIQTLKILKNIDQNLEVVMMSGHGAIDTAVRATKLGAYDFIEKPFSLEKILRSVTDALRHREERMAVAQPSAAPAAAGGLPLESWFAGVSPEAQRVRAQIESAARHDQPALILGPAGLGKEAAANLIHQRSRRAGNPFVTVSLDGMDDRRFDALLGAGGGAAAQADGGTLYLERVDHLPAKLQRALLRLLAGHAPRARILASCEEGARRGVRASAAQRALMDFFGPSVIALTPLSSRPADVPVIVERFVRDLAHKYHKQIDRVEGALIDALANSPLPGNTRELYNFLELAVLACEDRQLTGAHISVAGRGALVTRLSEARGRRIMPIAAGMNSSRRALPQRTLRNSVVLCGQGLHSGIKTGLILSPLPPGSGIVFWDIGSGVRVAARPENVRSTEYATTLARGDVNIKTIEHILSALHSYHITNLLVKVGDEAPIMDGSALDFCQIIENGEVEDQDAFIEPIVIDRPLSVGDPEHGPSLSVEPAEEFSVHYYLDYPPPIGRQEHHYVYESGERYRESIAPARTFGFLKDIKMLEEAGLASGGKLSNFILIDSEKIVNTPLRFPNEPARHKILDLIGDLYLLGRPILGRFTARRSGHTHNLAMVKKIAAEITGAAPVTKEYAAG